MLTFVNINVELAIGPLLLLFVRYIFDPERAWKRSDSLQFLPFTVGVSAWLVLYAVLRSRSPPPDLGRFETFIPVYVALKAGFFYTYWTCTVLTLRREIARTHLSAGRQGVEMGWLLRWLLGFGGLAALLYSLVFIDAYVVPVASDDYASFILAVMIYLVSLMVLVRPLGALGTSPAPPAGAPRRGRGPPRRVARPGEALPRSGPGPARPGRGSGPGREPTFQR